MYLPLPVLQFEFVALILKPLDNISIASLVDSAEDALANILKSFVLYERLEVS